MNIDLEKMDEMGFKVTVTKRRINIQPLAGGDIIAECKRQIVDILGFNEFEEEQLSYAVHRINVMSAIRKASNW